MASSMELRHCIMRMKMCCPSASGKWKCCAFSGGEREQSDLSMRSIRCRKTNSIRVHPHLLTTIAVLFLMIATLHMQLARAADSLMGDLESCDNEGEEVQIKGIQNSKCFKCICQNGFVHCDKSCPSIDDCYLLDAKSNDSCCRKCKGCMFRGVPYASGAEWSDPEEPCKTYKCIASVVTETIMKCYSQCDDNQLTPPRPGECCPTCQGCKINGQYVEEGQEVVASIDDRCLVCQCNNKKLSCAKKTCPILQCPRSKQKQFPNECCPRCTEQREFVPVTGKCIFNKQVHYDKTQFTPDRCTNCTCLNGTSICQRATCPILECAPEYQEDDGGCCPRCISAEVRSECIHKGMSYKNNETWEMGPCRSCRCTAGNIRCSEMRCQPLKCRANEELKAPAGECCPKCMETAGVCTVFGDPHFKTFDGKFFSFQGSCKYQLTKDCYGHTFSIRLTNDGRSTRRSAWPKTVTLKMRDTRVNLGQKMRIKVNGSRVQLPYNGASAGHASIVSIERNALGNILLKTELGLSIEWDGNNFLQVAVPAHYKHRLCGLCGNFNGSGRDDLTGRDGTRHTEAQVWHFANSWKVGGPKSCSRTNEQTAAVPVCNKRKSKFYCEPLSRSNVFGNCDSRLNPINYIASCRMDVCECPTGMCHCDSFAAYAHECQRAGVQLPDWRAALNCTVSGAGGWRRNTASLASFTHNSYYGDANLLEFHARHGADAGAGAGVTYKARRRKPLQQQQHHQQQRRQQNQLMDNEFIKKHVPINLLQPRAPNRTPPPLH